MSLVVLETVTLFSAHGTSVADPVRTNLCYLLQRVLPEPMTFLYQPLAVIARGDIIKGCVELLKCLAWYLYRHVVSWCLDIVRNLIP